MLKIPHEDVLRALVQNQYITGENIDLNLKQPRRRLTHRPHCTSHQKLSSIFCAIFSPPLSLQQHERVSAALLRAADPYLVPRLCLGQGKSTDGLQGPGAPYQWPCNRIRRRISPRSADPTHAGAPAPAECRRGRCARRAVLHYRTPKTADLKPPMSIITPFG